PCGSVARLERSLAALPDRLRFARGVLAGEGDVGDVGERDAHASSGRLVEQVEVRGAAIVDETDQLGTVGAPQRHVPPIIERPLHELCQPGIRHSRPVTMAATVAPIARGESKVARTALGSNPQCTMQSWQRGLPLLRPYRDQSVSSISSRNVFAYPSCSR